MLRFYLLAVDRSVSRSNDRIPRLSGVAFTATEVMGFGWRNATLFGGVPRAPPVTHPRQSPLGGDPLRREDRHR